MSPRADVPYTFQDRVAAVESATRFQDMATTVLKEVAETTDALKTQVGTLIVDFCRPHRRRGPR